MSKTHKFQNQDSVPETKAQKELQDKLKKYPGFARYDFSEIEKFFILEDSISEVVGELDAIKGILIEMLGALHDNKIHLKSELCDIDNSIWTLQRLSEVLEEVEKTAYIIEEGGKK